MMGRPSQLPLELAFRPAHGRDDFLIGACNADAVAWIDRDPSGLDDRAMAEAVLCGPAGSGKSHLLAVWADRTGALVLDAKTLSVANLDTTIGNAQTIALDNADAATEPDSLFHLINLSRERRARLMVACREAPARWTIGPADLRSRLATMTLLRLGAPDDAVLTGVLLKQLDDRGLSPAPDVPRFLVARMPRAFDAVGTVVADLDRESLAARRRITVPLARESLARLGY